VQLEISISAIIRGIKLRGDIIGGEGECAMNGEKCGISRNHVKCQLDATR